MIFVTVGSQLPFDRLVRAVDDWARETAREDVFAQISDSSYVPHSIQFAHDLEPPQFLAKMQAASLVVAHAGMGTILTALQLGKALLVMPRRGDLRETRNDHQVATAQRFRERGQVQVAMDEGELVLRLSDLSTIPTPEPIGNTASDELIGAIRAFIEQDERKP